VGDDITRLLADQPSHRWAESLRRVAVVDEYLSLSTPTTADADRCAAVLDLSQRTFFRLTRATRELRAGATPSTRKRGKRVWVDPATDHVIAQTIEDLGPGATIEEVLAESRKRCASDGLPLPSRTAVRTRSGRGLANPDLRRRLASDAELIIDASPLELVITSRSGQASAAILIALIDMETGDILGHDVGADEVTIADIAGTFLSALEVGPDAITVASATMRLIVTEHLRDHAMEIQDICKRASIELDVDNLPRLRAGEALLPTIGHNLGRVPIAPRLRRHAYSTKDAVPAEDAKNVITELLSRRAQSLGIERRTSLASLVGPTQARQLRIAALETLKTGR